MKCKAEEKGTSWPDTDVVYRYWDEFPQTIDRTNLRSKRD